MNDVDADEAEDRGRGDPRRPAGPPRSTPTTSSTWAGAEAAVAAAVDRLGRLDILVNNAGILRDAMSFSMDEEQWDSTSSACTSRATPRRAALRRARTGATGPRRGEDGSPGRIINTASESGLYGLAGQINYADRQGRASRR